MFKTQSIEPASYVSPVCKIIDVKLQHSFLQSSGNLSVAPWEEDDTNLDLLSF